MMIQVPPHLYLYMREQHRICDVLVNRRLYFSDPSDFNDPFDCALGIQFPNPEELIPELEEQWKEYLIHITTEGPGLHTSEENQNAADRFIKDEQHKKNSVIQEYREAVRAEIKAVGRQMGVLCLSSNPKSIMMWAHYADNHKGSVFRFNTDYMYAQPSGEMRCFPVDYKDTFPTLAEYLSAIHALKEGDAIALNRLFLCRKSNDWIGESEWRFFSETPNSHVPFDPPMLDGVIFGWKMEEDIKSVLKSCLFSYESRLRVYDSKPSYDKFEMELQEHPDW